MVHTDYCNWNVWSETAPTSLIAEFLFCKIWMYAYILNIFISASRKADSEANDKHK